MAKAVKLTLKDRDLGLREILKNIEADRKYSSANVGIMGGGEELEKAVKNEFGDKASGTPERPFMRDSFDAIEGELQKKIIEVADHVLTGKMTKERALMELGGKYIARIYKYIAGREHGIANSKATIEAKGGADLPLVDSGKMRQGIKQELRK